VALCLMGPTAAGKTDVALALAERTDVALVSVDSAMVYRHMDIGTAKPDSETLARHPHALVDVRDPVDAFSASDFLEGADGAVRDAFERGRLPVLVGGTMLYFKAFRDGLSELPEADVATRTELSARAREVGWAALHAELRDVDPAAAARIRPSDPQRIQRALEVFRLTGRPISDWWSASSGVSAGARLNCDLVCVGVTAPRDVLADRVARRFDAMLERGFVDEVRRLRAMPGLDSGKPAMRAVGYRQIWRHLDGETGFEAMREAALSATRQLVRRQTTWLRAWPGLNRAEGSVTDIADEILRRVPQSA
ncbi:MAG: tRNA (adenosine(37)-N6)-dimethylallyltransferase MiaA, partial [Gammaproteobacteria bacterium]|nr:tRNA (adenosine(37)-N6)-dimethylallyltransferase MiaA [Gammaproteobacteria bacterium]